MILCLPIAVRFNPFPQRTLVLLPLIPEVCMCAGLFLLLIALNKAHFFSFPWEKVNLKGKIQSLVPHGRGTSVVTVRLHDLHEPKRNNRVEGSVGKQGES